MHGTISTHPHLLKTFIDAEQRSPHTIMWQVIIHVAFLLSALAMAWVDRMVSHPAAHPAPHPASHPARGARSHGVTASAAQPTH